MASVVVHRDLESIAPEWEQLADRVDGSPFLRPGWIGAWWRAFGTGRLEIVALRADGRLVGLVPLYRCRGTVRSITNWHSPEFSFLVQDEAVAVALASALLGRGARRVQLAFLDPERAGLRECHAVAARAGYRTLERTLERCPYIVIGGDRAKLEDGVSGKLIRDLGRRRRRLEEQGSVSVEVADGRERFEELLEEGFRVEASGWKGERGTAIASRPETRIFYRDVAAWAAERGWLRLFFLRLDGRPLAFELTLAAGGALYRLKGGFDPDWQKYSPGKLLLHATLTHAFGSGLKRFEFLGEDDPFKLEWTNSYREMKLLQVFAPTAPGFVDWTAYAYGRPIAKRVLALLRR
jgi:CelD/BcsL family acetyltransferase involved in cellulose biosynthesis